KPDLARPENLIHRALDEVPAEQVALDPGEAPPQHPAQSDIIYPEQTNEGNENPEKEDTMIAYLAITLAIIALVLVALPLFKKKEPQPVADFYGLQERLDELAVRMKHLEQKLSDGQVKDEAITNLIEIMESVEKRVVELENRCM